MRDTVLHFGTLDSDYQKVLKRYAEGYGLEFVATPRDHRDWRNGTLPKLRRAAFVFIWNGWQGRGPLTARYCRRRGIPHAFMEYGMLPQQETFYIDPCGFCGDSRLCGDLGWVTPEDMRRLSEKREELRELHPCEDNGDILVPMQIFADTQVLYHTPYDTMQEFVADLKSIFPQDRLVIRPHPNGVQDYSKYGLRVQSGKQIGYMEAMSKCQAVVGLTSTCLMEAAVYGKPVLALGDCALRQHGPLDHDRVAAGSLAMTVHRHKGDVAPILERFGLRPLGAATHKGAA